MVYLPGQVVKFRGGLCEDCGEIGSVTIVGETDSFGSEFITLCKSCYEKDINKEPEPQPCEWCNKEAICSPIRDIDEGSHGPVYFVCSACRAKQNKYIQEELDFLNGVEKRNSEEEEFLHYGYHD